jgi:pimeloyl-ACP methyl ester carboxylesterase
MIASPFRIQVADDVLDDLQLRIARTRLPPRTGTEPWAAGTDPDYLKQLLAYWGDGFDWRAIEAELNSRPHYRAEVDGRLVHFVRLEGRRAEGEPATLPLILTHGWPSCFVEMLRLAELLADPARHGGDAADAFDVVVPSLPGFVFSELPGEPLTRAAIAHTWHELMTDVLGYSRFGAFGGDIGAGVTGWLGARYPEQVAGVHVIHPSFPDDFDESSLSDAERAFIEADAAYDEADGGYSAIMSTRPDTVAAALIDSPAGLAAWIVDKFRAWSDCGGDLESRFDRDHLLTIVTLYWVTGTIGSSFRQYYDWDHNPTRPMITVPAAVTLSCEPVVVDYPRELAERAYSDIRHWTEPGTGGHFMAMEEPELLADELRSFFRPLREPDGTT